MRFRCLKALSVFLALLAWVVLFVATPVHLYVAHSHHDDCPACRAAEEHAQCTCCSCNYHGEADSNEVTLSRKPPEHNHEFHCLGEFCITCQILFAQNKISAPTAITLFESQFVWEYITQTLSAIPSAFCRTYSSRAPPA